jgi:hypothetical protein
VNRAIKYHYIHIYHRILRRWCFRQKVPIKVHVNTAYHEEKYAFKKDYRTNNWGQTIQQQQNEEKKDLR